MNSEDKNILPSQFAENIGNEYASKTTPKHKKLSGQFFTSKNIADYMASLAYSKKEHISILDPGCGTGILSCSLIESLIQKSKLKRIDLNMYEIDSEVLNFTKLVLDYLSDWLKQKDIEFNYNLLTTDFIIDNSSVFNKSNLFGIEKHKTYDYIISNPPYFKISTNDIRAKVANLLVYGQPNIYALFMGVAAKLLNHDGELIFITPRSFAAGNYFKAFRNSFFFDASISNIHIFESRNKMFKTDNVLQENIIIRATKASNNKIAVSTSNCDKGLFDSKVIVYKTESLLDLKSKDKILFIPSNNKEAKSLEFFLDWKNTLNDYNIQISTGPVVAFRSTDFLVTDGQINEYNSPLIWLHNVKEMKLEYPLVKKNKQSLIKNNPESRKLLLRNKNYVLIRRFSAKDDKSRLVCCPYFSSNFDVEFIGIENHVNYVHRPSGELSENEIWGISGLLNSSLFDTYFRTFNGNTQVGASELKQIKMPPLSEIELVGSHIKALPNYDKQQIDEIINNVLINRRYDKITGSSPDIARIGVA